jgi:hypothetical protein
MSGSPLRAMRPILGLHACTLIRLSSERYQPRPLFAQSLSPRDRLRATNDPDGNSGKAA